jgi:hypothetical protein
MIYVSLFGVASLINLYHSGHYYYENKDSHDMESQSGLQFSFYPSWTLQVGLLCI